MTSLTSDQLLRDRAHRHQQVLVAAIQFDQAMLASARTPTAEHVQQVTKTLHTLQAATRHYRNSYAPCGCVRVTDSNGITTTQHLKALCNGTHTAHDLWT